MRVMGEGVEVKWQVDTWRVGPAALQVTRSIGDDDLKPAVTANPEIIVTCISADDDFLVFYFELYCPVQVVRTGPTRYRYADRPLPGGTIETRVSLGRNEATPRLPTRDESSLHLSTWE
ncbi:hypothetical protein B296_00031061 [Ensete ventricosum]|uniref:protein-serine/threonine phosphatase n=1 Tax=Ensete ventricosum TaxID=4639 RepID=A0A427AH56_ENSVE|nr:hypothetical protein B296_00031061 [Ensete ventricosum]